MEIELTKGMMALVSEQDYERVNAFKWYAHKAAWKKFYAARRTLAKDGPRKFIYMHRLIMDAPPDKVVDHIDGDTLNNLRENLNLCSQSENIQNTECRSNSGFKGVYEYDDRFQAKITKCGKTIFIGSYREAEEAAIAYDMKARRLFGDNARTNFKMG